MLPLPGVERFHGRLISGVPKFKYEMFTYQKKKIYIYQRKEISLFANTCIDNMMARENAL